MLAAPVLALVDERARARCGAVARPHHCRWSIAWDERGALDWLGIRWALVGRVLGTFAGAYAVTRLDHDAMAIALGSARAAGAVAISLTGWHVRPTDVDVGRGRTGVGCDGHADLRRRSTDGARLPARAGSQAALDACRVLRLRRFARPAGPGAEREMGKRQVVDGFVLLPGLARRSHAQPSAGALPRPGLDSQPASSVSRRRPPWRWWSAPSSEALPATAGRVDSRAAASSGGHGAAPDDRGDRRRHRRRGLDPGTALSHQPAEAAERRGPTRRPADDRARTCAGRPTSVRTWRTSSVVASASISSAQATSSISAVGVDRLAGLLVGRREQQAAGLRLEVEAAGDVHHQRPRRAGSRSRHEARRPAQRPQPEGRRPQHAWRRRRPTPRRH